MNGADQALGWRGTLAVAGGAVAAIVIVALVVVAGATTRQRDAALDWQQHSYEAMIIARTLDATMGQSEAMLGRYVISGEKDLGRLYFDKWRRAGTLIDALDRQITDAPMQAMIDRLRVLYGVRGQELAAVALRTNYGQNPQALSKYYDAGQSPNVKRMATLVNTIIARERSVLSARTIEADATIGRSNAIGGWLAVVGVGLLAGALVLGIVLFNAFSARRNESRRAEDLEEAVASRTGQLSEANVRLLQEMAVRASAETRLRQAQKMEAVGQLTGGIAHDFNNMLSVVIGGLELAKRRLEIGGRDVGRHLDSAMEGAARAAALTRRLLAFARAEPLLPSAVDPNALVDGMAELLDRTIGDTIRVSIMTAHDLWPVFVDAHQLENAVLNLAVNARDAMPHGGVLSIETANTAIDDDTEIDADAGDYVKLVVRDTGVGMTREVLDRIFEPFFTTKPVGKGTGLGLSQIFGFVRQSGGTITADSTPGSGTVIAILLPRHRASAIPIERVARRVSPVATALDRAKRVLVVEDDPRVLQATCEAIEELGHHALPCAIAAAAPALIDGRGQEIDLIVSDVLMPDMTGPELIAAIRPRHPHLPVLFVTGFAGDIEESAAFGGHEVLRKPFTINALGLAIERVLAPAEARAA